MSAVTVKPLVWIERVSGFWQAIDPTGGVYEVMKISENRAVCHHLIAGHGRNIGNGHQSPQDGMTAVQSDYAARILPAITTQPDPRDEIIATLVDALGHAQYGLSWAVQYFKDQDVTKDDPCPPCTRGLSATRAALAAEKAVQK